MSNEAWDDYCERINDTNEEIQDRIEYHAQCLAKWQGLEKEFHAMDPKEDIDKFLEFYHEHIYCRRNALIIAICNALENELNQAKEFRDNHEG